MTNTLRALAALCLLTFGLIASGCGSSSGAAGGTPASVVPESSFLYAEATIDPSGSQESAMRSILGDLPGTGAPQDRLENLIREAIKKDRTTKVDWDKDIKPWLGDKVAGFVAGGAKFGPGGNAPPAAFIVATTDGDAARDALEKDKDPGDAHRRYRDLEYLVSTKDGDVTAAGVVDGYLVVGDDAGMKATIDASKDGRTLDKSDKFKQAVKDVPDERVGFAYTDIGGLLQLVQEAAGNRIPAGALFGRLLAGKPLVVTARAENQALVFEGTGGGSLTKSAAGAGALLQQMPEGSWAALAIPGFGDVVRSAVTAFAGFVGGEERLNQQLRQAAGLDLDELLSWIGDVGVFVDGDSKESLGGGVLIKSKDPAKSKRVLTKLAALITKTDTHPRVSAARIPGAFGYEASDADTPRGVFMVQKDDLVALTYGEDEAKAALGGAPLSGSADFKRAADGLGDGFSPALYVSVAPILRVADAFGAASDKDYVQARPYLSTLDYLIAGSSGDHGRLRIGFKPHE
jgi:hypothetical protein